MKKLVILLSAGVLAFAMTACGSKDNGEAQTTQESTASSVESTESPSQATEETQAASETQPAGTETEAVGSESWSEEMTAVKDAVVKALGENYWPDSPVPAEVLEGNMGITSDMYDDYMAEMPMISTHVDTLLIIKAKSDKVDEVEKALNAYRDVLVNDTMQYPMNLGKIQASKVEKIGDYVCFVQLGADTTEASESGDEAVITHCQEQNDLAIEAIRQAVEQ